MEKERADKVLKVLVSAYVWIASVDGGVDLAEFHKYEQAIMQSQFATQFNVEDMRRYFKDMVALFADDFEAGKNLTKERLQEIRGQDYLVHEVIRLCRAATVGDFELKEAEEVVLNEIASILGLTEVV
ncbi:MAG: tellurite resistance TerB family protein [Bdellovibrionaceae bacterium]|nr:tellurite resistance TerB family protein [Pseudobdellovibrionaceae bacterium]